MDNIQTAFSEMNDWRYKRWHIPANVTEDDPDYPTILEAAKVETETKYNYWVEEVHDLYYRAMWITFLMYGTWMFTFHHIYEAVFAAKNKRVAKFVLLENILDFWIMLLGIGYISIVYRVYRYDTFLS